MIFRGFTVFIESLRVIRAKPVEPLAVLFVSSTAPEDWSVMVEDVGRAEDSRSRKAERRFRQAAR